MEPQNPTLRGLFALPAVYKIPYYQRAYVWDKDNQWEPLWFDLISIADRLIDANQSAATDLKPHFLGAAVFKEVTRPGEEVRVYTVVDGQQRVTTTQLLLAAVADAFREDANHIDSERLARSLTINSILGDESRLAPFKSNPLGRDYVSFGEVMYASKSDTRVPPRTGRMGECYRFFLEKAQT